MHDCQLNLWDDFNDEWEADYAAEGIAEIESFLAKRAAFHDFCAEKDES